MKYIKRQVACEAGRKPMTSGKRRRFVTPTDIKPGTIIEYDMTGEKFKFIAASKSFDELKKYDRSGMMKEAINDGYKGWMVAVKDVETGETSVWEYGASSLYIEAGNEADMSTHPVSPEEPTGERFAFKIGKAFYESHLSEMERFGIKIEDMQKRGKKTFVAVAMPMDKGVAQSLCKFLTEAGYDGTSICYLWPQLALLAGLADETYVRQIQKMPNMYWPGIDRTGPGSRAGLLIIE